MKDVTLGLPLRRIQGVLGRVTSWQYEGSEETETSQGLKLE